jgi:LCP family protein required for cell wall assembly
VSAGQDAVIPQPAGEADSLQGRRRTPRRFAATLGLTALGAVLPGTAFLAAGRRKLGAFVLLLFALVVGVVVWLVTGGWQTAFRLALDTRWLLGIAIAVGLGTLAWVAVIVAGYRMLAAPGTTRGRHVLGSVVVLLLVVAVALPAVYVGQLLLAQRGLVDGVFAEDRESATVEENPDPFGDQERVNVLLLGGDGGEGRDGVRTDTVIVASIATATGETTLFSLPRNLEDLPFPADSPLAELYPDGFDAGTESESLLNAVYRNGPAEHPDALGRTADPGADFLKLGVGEALGLDLDYFVLVNLDGFSRLVDALGGVTVNVNYWVPVGGIPDSRILPDDYLEPGPNQHFDGAQALDFARGRFGLTDYDRMARQRCTIDAIVDAADPVTLLRSYQELAATTRDIVSTDIPRSALDDFVDLAFLVKDASIRSVVFDATLIDPAYPDYDEMRRIVQEAIDPAPAAEETPESSPAPTSAAPTPVEDPDAPRPPEDPAADVGDACAYDRAQAEEALAAGKPPTRRG